MMTGKSFHRSLGLGCTRHETGTNPTTGGWSPTKRVQERIVELQLTDPGLELLDKLTECAVLGLKVDVARHARLIAVGGPHFAHHLHRRQLAQAVHGGRV